MIPFLQYQEHGPDYIHALLLGYEEPPAGFVVPPTGHYNKYFPGHVIAMPKPISDGQVEYPKGPDGRAPVPETVDQYAKDIAAFLMWAAEPSLEQRKRIGFMEKGETKARKILIQNGRHSFFCIMNLLH